MNIYIAPGAAGKEQIVAPGDNIVEITSENAPIVIAIQLGRIADALEDIRHHLAQY